MTNELIFDWLTTSPRPELIALGIGVYLMVEAHRAYDAYQGPQAKDAVLMTAGLTMVAISIGLTLIFNPS